MSRSWFGCASLVLSGLIACGGGSSGGATCASASEALCARACECGDPQCRFGDGSGGSVSFDTERDCVQFLKLGCSSSAGVDFEACEADTAAAACVGTGSDRAFASPASCDNGQ